MTATGIATNAIFDPAEIVKNTSTKTSGRVSSRANVDQPTAISQLSLARARNGDAKLSADSIKAIRNGATPPIISAPPKVQDDALIIDISNEAMELASTGAIASVTQSSADVGGAAASVDVGSSVDISV